MAAAGVFAMSLSSLLLELALTRLFSAILFYHFAFLAISIALLGLGAGGVFAYVKRAFLARWETPRLGAAVAAINAVAIVGTLEVVLRVPVALEASPANLLRLAAVYLASVAPFFLTGLLFSVVFARGTREAPRLYAADLAGGSVACLALVPLLNSFGGPNTVLFAALGMALASVCWADSAWGRRRGAAIAAALAGLIAANGPGRLIDAVYMKGRRSQAVEFSRWNALSRVEVHRGRDGARWATIDGDAATGIMDQAPLGFAGSPAYRRMMLEVPAVANVLRPRGEFAIIGPGGGAEVLRAVGAGSPGVWAIEINPLIATTVMRERYAEYSHRLYELPQVRIHVADGRSWIRAGERRFDVVQMTLVDTWAATAAGAFALSENNLYTVEAFQEYLEHLRPDGMLAVTRWEFRRPREALRVVAVAMEALRRLGVRDPARHFIVAAQGPLDAGGVPVLVLAKRSPFTAREESSVLRHLEASEGAIRELDWRGRRPPLPLTALYLPGGPRTEPFSGLIASGDAYAFSRDYDFNVAPVTDDAPFFFFTMKLEQILSPALRGSLDWKVNVGVAVLGTVLGLSIAAIGAFLLLPLSLSGGPRSIGPLFYFIAVGLGYIAVEIAFIQRFVLFLGHPTYAITVVVFLMLSASGAGSLASGRWLPDPRRVWVVLALIVGAGLVYIAALPRLLHAGVGLPLPVKLLVSAGLLAPLAGLMGMPLPSGLRALRGAGEAAVEWAWALNAAAGVLGSVLATVVAVRFGLSATLAFGASAYLLAALLTRTFSGAR